MNLLQKLIYYQNTTVESVKYNFIEEGKKETIRVYKNSFTPC